MSPPGGGDAKSLPALPTAHRHSSSAVDAVSRDYQYQEMVSGLPAQETSVSRSIRTARASPTRPFSNPHTPPVRDAASIKGVKYGNGHEKYPSWPTSAAAEVPIATRSPPTGGSHRSKSWTDHTQYPKENLVLYTRPYMKRHRQQQLKPVFEITDRTMPGPFKSHREEETKTYEEEKRYEEREESFVDKDYGLPSPPEREVPIHQNLSEYSTVYEVKKMVIQQDMKTHYYKYQGSKETKKLTQAELEEYSKNYEEALQLQHQKQSSYAQSEGYHSYVSSTDSTSTPFLDRLRREADASVSRSDSGLSSAAGGAGWDAVRGDRDSVVTTSSGSGSSSETLKWHGSLSDISVASSSLSLTSKQLIAHSAKVKTPQRHGSESVLYIARPAENEIEHRAVPPGNCQKHLKLFPVSTYAVPDSSEQRQISNNRVNASYSPPQMTVAERVNELERQNKYAAYQDGKRQTRVGDPSLKAKQKSAVQSFYERQQQKENKLSWRSEPQLASSQPPPPLPQARPQPPSRRASSASDYADWRERDLALAQSDTTDTSTPEQHKQPHPLNVPNSTRFSPNSVLEGPVIVGTVISLDDWVPERPPKNAKFLRNLFPDLYQDDARLPSPDLPLPSPPTVLDDEVCSDEPFPPPPAEITEWSLEHEAPQRLGSDNTLKQSHTEIVARPLPIRPKKPHDVDCNVSHPAMVDHSRQGSRLIALKPSITTPYCHNANKRPYSNLKEKVHRNSFRSPNDNSSQITLPQNIRASMRNYRSNLAMQSTSPQMPVISAQKLLLRSTTIDESIPKKPINAFLRSTSLRKNEPNRKSLPLAPPPLKYPCDRIQTHTARHSSSSAAYVFNGNLSSVDIAKESVGHYRPECDKSKSVVSKIEQLQQKLKGVDMLNDSVSFNSSGVPASMVSGHHGATSKKIQPSAPPPLYPKQSLPSNHIKPIAPEAISVNRSSDNVCYAPSRAKLQDPSTGSYKLIQPKEEPSPRPKPSTMPDLLQNDVKPTYPNFEYITRRTCEKILAIPIDYSKRCSLELNQNSQKNCSSTYVIQNVEKDIESNNKVVEKPEPELEVRIELDTREDKMVNELDVEAESSVPAPTVVVEEDSSSEEEVETVVELPEITRWWETVPTCKDFTQARDKLLQALPDKHELRQLTSLTNDQRSPVEFIRDFFGAAPSTSKEFERPEEGAVTAQQEATAEHLSSLDQLMSDLVSCSERLVQALQAASAAVTAASTANEQLGATVLQRLPAPLSAKFTSHHTEVYHISSLMTALSARLARTYDESQLRDGEQVTEMRSKQEKLEEQLVEARSLKENIDARASTLAAKISQALDPQTYRDYRLFMAVKPRLVIRARHLQYRIEYEKGRLKALQQSLNDR